MKSRDHLGLASIIAVVAMSLTPPLWAEDMGPFKEMQTPIGKVVTDPQGMTLYTYDKDMKGQSNCDGECAEYWPPVKASASDKPAGDFTIIKRSDGTMQWADYGKPLYTFKNDKKPGDTTGDKKDNVWHAVMSE